MAGRMRAVTATPRFSDQSGRTSQYDESRRVTFIGMVKQTGQAEQDAGEYQTFVDTISVSYASDPALDMVDANWLLTVEGYSKRYLVKGKNDTGLNTQLTAEGV